MDGEYLIIIAVFWTSSGKIRDSRLGLKTKNRIKSFIRKMQLLRKMLWQRENLAYECELREHLLYSMIWHHRGCIHEFLTIKRFKTSRVGGCFAQL